MNPEREIVGLWLNKKGFFTLHSIPLANNKLIDILAIKVSNGKLDKILHVETACSISTLDNMPMQVYTDKFNDKGVEKKVNDTIRRHLGVDAAYEKLLVIGNTSKPQAFQKLDGIRTIRFEDILLDVIRDLNRQSYRNEAMRILQLVKYLLISKPSKMADMAGFNGENKFFTHQEREDFLRMLLEQKDVQKILGKRSMEAEIASILSESTLSRPEKLAEAIEGRLMTKRAKRKFERIIMARQQVKVNVKAEVKPKEKSLELFFD
jgi:hypothetical protein